ncbi:MAG: efflux RND transporter periplasmic adaptor subunit [Steroidobacteraceae bacterium]
MDRALARPPLWRRYAPHAVAGALAVGIAAWLLVGAGGRVYRTPIDRLTIAAVRRGPFEDYIAVRGAAAPFSTQYLTADQGGVVKQVLVEDGATVKAHQPLIVLANAALQLQVASREADTASQVNAIENTRLQLEEGRFKYQHDLLDIDHEIEKLKGDLARDKTLLDGNAIAPSVYAQEQAEYAYQIKLRAATVASRDTESQVRESELAQLARTLARLNESVDAAKASLDALTIRAPMDGQLTALDAEVGQSKAAGAVLGQVDSLDRFKLTADVDEFYLGRVALGQIALLTTDGRDYQAKVVKIYPQVANGTFRIDLHFGDPAPRAVHAGQAIDMRLELGGAATATMLPDGPFYQDTGGRWVFVVSPDGRSATRRNVRLGRRNPDYVEVLDGLEPGEKVIVSGYEAFQKVDRVEFEQSAHGG